MVGILSRLISTDQYIGLLMRTINRKKLRSFEYETNASKNSVQLVKSNRKNLWQSCRCSCCEPDFMNEHANIKTVDSNLLSSCVLFSFFKQLIRFAYKNTHTAPREDRGTYFNLFLTV